MPTPTKGTRLGGSPAHQRLILANLATSLFEHGRITTTEAKARRLRPFAEHLITKAKQGDLHARRQVLATITDKSVVHTLFTEIGPRFATRPGGYTRITKIGPRKGDNAAMAVIELVEELSARPAPTTRPARTASSPAPVAAAPPAAAPPAAAPPAAAPPAAAVDTDDAAVGESVVEESTVDESELEGSALEESELEGSEVPASVSDQPPVDAQPQDDPVETDTTPTKE